jgi:hypothetical protein
MFTIISSIELSMSIDHLLLSQLYYNFVKINVKISKVIGILKSEFLIAKIGFKIFSDIIKV